MKKYFLLILGFFFVVTTLGNAQTTTDTATAKRKWLITNAMSLQINQTGYTQWAGGAQNSFSLGAFDNFSATFRKNRYIFDSYANFAYGILKQQNEDFWRKTDDKIDMMINNSWKFKQNNDHWYYGALFTMNTLFSNGYDYSAGKPSDSTLKSSGFSPTYFNMAPGVTYRIGDRFSWFLSPCNGRMLFIANQRIANLGIYGNKSEAASVEGNPIGKKVNIGMGFLSEIHWKQNLTTGIDIDTKLRISNNYLDTRISNRLNFDIDYLLLLNFKVNKYISANIRMEILYDDDTHIVRKDKDGPVMQLKEIVGIGFAWNFDNHK
jgi:hypothetical protein